MSKVERRSRARLKWAVGGIAFAAFVGFSVVAVRAYQSIFHTAENAMAETACEGAVGTTPTPTLARLCLSLMTKPDAESRAWLQCVFEERKDCGRRTLTVTGILSALPRRSFVDVQIDDGLVRGCRITGAPGW
jgi:hypothetical protein